VGRSNVHLSNSFSHFQCHLDSVIPASRHQYSAAYDNIYTPLRLASAAMKSYRFLCRQHRIASKTPCYKSFNYLDKRPNPIFQRRRFELSPSLRACYNHDGQDKSRRETRNRPKGYKRCEESQPGPCDERCGQANATERQIDSPGSR